MLMHGNCRTRFDVTNTWNILQFSICSNVGHHEDVCAHKQQHMSHIQAPDKCFALDLLPRDKVFLLNVHHGTLEVVVLECTSAGGAENQRVPNNCDQV